MRYICVHYLDDYLRAVLEKPCPCPEAEGVRVVRFLPMDEDGKVGCEVDAPTEEAFLCWVTEVNARCREELVHEIPNIEGARQCQASGIAQRVTNKPGP